VLLLGEKIAVSSSHATLLGDFMRAMLCESDSPWSGLVSASDFFSHSLILFGYLLA
jgi:hypothetical protein